MALRWPRGCARELRSASQSYMYHRDVTFIVAFLFALPCCASPQSASSVACAPSPRTGVLVTESWDGRNWPGVTVTVKRKDGSVVASAITDTDGAAFLPLQAGDYVIESDLDGLDPQRTHVVLGEGMTCRASVILVPRETVEISSDCGALKISGTFTDLRPDGNTGMTGTEVRIVVTENGYQASLQFGNGELSDLFIGDADVDFDTRNWPLGVPLPEREPNTSLVQINVKVGPYAGTFEGKITKDALIGVFTLASGRKLSLNLPRQKGYWE